jgi:hypothetical protein
MKTTVRQVYNSPPECFAGHLDWPLEHTLLEGIGLPEEHQMNDNSKNPNEKQPGEKPEGKQHYNPGNQSGKEAGMVPKEETKKQD